MDCQLVQYKRPDLEKPRNLHILSQAIASPQQSIHKLEVEIKNELQFFFK